MKIAKVTPIYKEGNEEDPANCRPISSTSVLSKILERCTQARIKVFLEKNNYFYKRQHGFWKKQNITSVMDTIHNLNMNIDKGEAIGLLLDFKKAFDTIDHDRLLGHIASIGIRGFTKEWVKSYLEDRYQYVHCNSPVSDIRSTGVPQGSVLSPTLFTTYINDIGTMELQGQITMFADDAVIIHIKDKKTLQH